MGLRLTAGTLVEFLRSTNTFYLYLQKKNFRDAATRDKHKRQEALLEASLSLGRAFPVDVLAQIFENGGYSLEEILRDARKVDFESYFVKGGLTRNLDQGAGAAQGVAELPGGVLPVHQVHRGNGEHPLLRVADGPLVG